MKNYNSYVSAEVVCPFYQSEFPKKIKCEGFVDNVFIHVFFTSNAKKNRHKAVFCECLEEHVNCPVYQMAAQKYRGDEDL